MSDRHMDNYFIRFMAAMHVRGRTGRKKTNIEAHVERAGGKDNGQVQIRGSHRKDIRKRRVGEGACARHARECSGAVASVCTCRRGRTHQVFFSVLSALLSHCFA